MDVLRIAQLKRQYEQLLTAIGSDDENSVIDDDDNASRRPSDLDSEYSEDGDDDQSDDSDHEDDITQAVNEADGYNVSAEVKPESVPVHKPQVNESSPHMNENTK